MGAEGWSGSEPAVAVARRPGVPWRGVRPGTGQRESSRRVVAWPSGEMILVCAWGKAPVPSWGVRRRRVEGIDTPGREDGGDDYQLSAQRRMVVIIGRLSEELREPCG